MQLAALPRVISICTGSGDDQSMAMVSRDPDHNTGLTGRQCHTHQLIVRGIRVLLFYNPAPVRCYSCGNPDPFIPMCPCYWKGSDMVPFIAAILTYDPTLPWEPYHGSHNLEYFRTAPFLQGPYQQWLTSFVQRPPPRPGAARGRVCRSLSLDGPGFLGPGGFWGPEGHLIWPGMHPWSLDRTVLRFEENFHSRAFV